VFLTAPRADGDRSPWGDFWFEPVSVRTGAGVRVTADAAMRIAAVYRCVSLISGQFASLPFCLFRRQSDGTKKVITDHWLHRVFGKRANERQNAMEWRAMLQAHLELRGNAYNRIIPDGRGGVAQMVPMNPDRMKVELLDSGALRYRYQQPSGTEIVLSAGEVWHLRTLSTDGIKGLSTLDLARESFGVALATQDYASRFFANDAKPSGGWIEFPGTFRDREARQIFRDTWQAMQGGESRGKVAVLDNGMKFHGVELTNQDAQFLETRKMQVTEIARWFGVPPHKIADLEKATFSNIEQQAIEFVQDCLVPRSEGWEASIEADLLLDSEEGLEVEFDFSRLLRGDSAARAKYIHAGVLDGWMTRNEGRALEGYDPLPGLDEPLRPLNMVEEGEAADEIAEGDDGADDKPQPPAAPVPESRLAVVLAGNARRIARRVAKSIDGGHVNWGVAQDLVMDAMAVPKASASLWLSEAMSRHRAGNCTEQWMAESLMQLERKP